MRHLGVGSLARTLTLALGSTALTVVAALALTGAGLRPPPAGGLGGLLEYLARWSLLLAGGWSTLVLAAVLRAQVTGRRLGRLPCPRSWRPVVAALCGLGAATLGTLPAGAASPATLPSLGRPSGGLTSHIVVRPGDSLWSIVVRRHPGEPAGVTARRVGRLHRANRDLIGPDADLIRPGQRLVADDRDPGAA